MNRPSVIAGTLLAVLVLVDGRNGAAAQVPEPAFTIIADSAAQGFDPFEVGCPALNDAGQVAFRIVRDDGVQAIVRGSGGSLTVIARDDRRLDFLGRNPSINASGEVSFAATLDRGGEAILRGDGRKLKTIATTDPGPFAFFGFDTSLNDDGRVAFKAELDDEGEGLFSGADRRITTHYLASTSPFLGDDSGPAINNAGQIAFGETLDEFEDAIGLVTGDGIVVVADGTGPLGSLGDPSINEPGDVVFSTLLDEGGEAILVGDGDGGPLTTVADTTGAFGFFGFGGPSINDAGEVAFTAGLDDRFETGLYVDPGPEPGPEADEIIAPGDPLAGSTVVNVVACRESLNDTGQVAFSAQLEDGRSVVVRADR